ncbi:MAG: hypothetical protein H0X12_17070 [Nocardioides sp.]|nr:hypothetical protein [Nocardioides sp.]
MDGTITETDLSTTLLKKLNGGAAGFQVVTVTSPQVGPLGTAVVSAACTDGKVAISANAYWLGDANLVAPQVRRNGPGSFTSKASFPVGLVGLDSVQLQVTCVNAA